MKRLAVLLLAAAPLLAGDAPAPKRHFTREMWVRVGIHAGLAVLDWHSSQGQRELNPLLRNQQGGISGGRFLALNVSLIGGAFAAEYMDSSRPRRNTWTKRILTWGVIGGRGALIANNYRMRGAR